MKKLAKCALLLLTAVLCIGVFAVTASAATTSRTTTKTSTRTITMASKAKVNKTTTKTTTKQTTKKARKNNVETTTVTTVRTTVQNSIRKNSNIKTSKTTVKTNVKTTTRNIKSASVNTVTSQPAAAGTVSTDINVLASKAGANVRNAFNTLGFSVKVNGGVNYSGHFDAKSQTITLKNQNDACIYHELGHFVAFVAGNADKKAEFQAIFNAEKGKYTAANRTYVTSSSSEYFAESYKNYVENPSALKAARPQTYAYIAKALSTVNDAQIAKVAAVYGPIWK